MLRSASSVVGAVRASGAAAWAGPAAAAAVTACVGRRAASGDAAGGSGMSLDEAAEAARVVNARKHTLERMHYRAAMHKLHQDAVSALGAWRESAAKAAAERSRRIAAKSAERSAIFAQLREARRAAKQAEETERLEVQERLNVEKERKYAARSEARIAALEAMLQRLDASSRAWAQPDELENFIDAKLQYLTAHDGLFPFELEEVKARRAERAPFTQGQRPPQRRGQRGAGARGANTRGANARGANARGPGARGPGARGPGARGPGARGPGARGPGARGRPQHQARGGDGARRPRGQHQQRTGGRGGTGGQGGASRTTAGRNE
ncbi:uncharacterized protein AMSG_04930 [Thecamonas trahens ATCC 50062]|uniref:Uncharacterized protein n=1 Tax=Thecamonas trahens ATCC 50062 TaxID=461836 RepID=A0A0L0D7X1_THETB|nr:hypothetical protein AMSG_04930 [Thecamonas trahens ATCC 50062]KNC48482.1 hypothetical protein AMSG_04930 [Thecamonas trahens ATCC 50062]|eukprot:XP_013758594.1 hypothetical protein AMSG_04930 [Thecamonas trahens ATCC 50062]